MTNAERPSLTPRSCNLAFFGAVFDGDWQGKKQQGRGRMTYASGNVYDGEWKDGEQEGRGKMPFANGDLYNGEWKGGKQQGRALQWHQRTSGEHERTAAQAEASHRGKPAQPGG
jgi:hypothetical protein